MRKKKKKKGLLAIGRVSLLRDRYFLKIFSTTHLVKVLPFFLFNKGFFGHWSLGSGHLDIRHTELMAMICLIDKQ